MMRAAAPAPPAPQAEAAQPAEASEPPSPAAKRPTGRWIIWASVAVLVGGLGVAIAVRVNAVGVKVGAMVAIPGGTFTKGPRDDSVTVTVAVFAMDRTEVTVAAYKACVEAGKCSAAGTGQDCNWGVSGRDNHPINCVDWKQATTYCEAQGKRLPSDDEWVWAGRGGEAHRSYPWGNEAPAGQLCWSGDGKGPRQSTCPVSSYPAGHSKHGVHDLAGNVSEWTSSPWAGGLSRRVRGGSWNNEDAYLMLDGIGGIYAEPGERHFRLGFRCARTQ